MPKEKTLEERLEEELSDEEEETEQPKKQSKAKKDPSGNEVELDWGMDPTERLKTEMEALEEKDQMRLVAKMLIEEFAKDPNLAKAYKDRKVTLKAVIDYITKEARKLAVQNCAMVSDETVYGWAIHFVQDGVVKETKDKTLTVNVLTKKTEDEIAEQAKKDFYEAEMKKLEEEKRKAEEKVKKAEKRAKAKAAEKAKKEAEKNADQMSIFEFFEITEGGQA